MKAPARPLTLEVPVDSRALDASAGSILRAALESQGRFALAVVNSLLLAMVFLVLGVAFIFRR